jgi:hypothetical protein
MPEISNAVWAGELLASITAQDLMQQVEQFVHMLCYKRKPVLVGSRRLIHFRGRWYSPVFWAKHSAFLVFAVMILPLVAVAAGLNVLIVELKGTSREPRTGLEKDFQGLPRLNPEEDFSI